MAIYFYTIPCIFIMNAKFFGGILMILGTSIGAGMLALPVATAHENYVVSVVLLIFSWLVMTVSAFALLNVNIKLPEGSNLISMAKATLGWPGQMITWIVYLLLLYSLLCAYISGSNDILYVVLSSMNIHIPSWLSVIITTSTLGFVVYRGIYSVDILNRGLMSAKLIILSLLVFVMLPHIKLQNLVVGSFMPHVGALMVMITSFGYAIIIPSLRVYFKSDLKKLRLMVFVGSLLPLIIYLLWITAIQGVISRGWIIHVAESHHVVALLMSAINSSLHSVFLGRLANIFISICAITSFLGVSLCLTDFIADGMKLKRGSKHDIFIFLKAFLPPLLIVIFLPGIFIKALSYAGVLCVILLIILPLLMYLRSKFLPQVVS